MHIALAKNEWPGGNLILSAVPPEERGSSAAHLERVELRSAVSLHRAGDRLTHLYFPIDAVVATSTAEYVLIGNEGFIGLNALLGDSRAGGDAVVLLPGRSYRLAAKPLSEAFDRSHVLRRVVLRYVSSRVFQTSQTSLCNAHHRVEQRLCRWLLQARDRVSSSELRITHELIGLVQGLRREAVSVAAMRLQARGAIRCSRGRITVLDRGTLEALSCECYAKLKRDLELMAHDISLM